MPRDYGMQVVGKNTSKHIPTGNDMMEFYLGPSCYVINHFNDFAQGTSESESFAFFGELSNPPAGRLGFGAQKPFLHFSG